MEKKAVLLAILLTRFLFSAVQIISKASFDEGVNTYVFVFYKQAIATLILAPIAFIFERKNFPEFSLSDYVNVFIIAFCGVTISNDSYFNGLRYTSATLGTAASNSVPVITFVLAVLLRKESINGEYSIILPKLGGVMLCLVGVLAMAFYRGRDLHFFSRHQIHLVPRNGDKSSSSKHPNKHWELGSLLVILANTLYSLFLILQKNLLRKCPSALMLTSLLASFATVQTFLAALIFGRDFSKWKFALYPIDILVYCISSTMFFLQCWCIKKVGPVIYAMYVPLSLVITMLISLFILGEAIPLGSVIGGALTVGGLYSVLLAKHKQQKREEQSSANQERSDSNLGKINKPNPCNPPNADRV